MNPESILKFFFEKGLYSTLVACTEVIPDSTLVQQVGPTHCYTCIIDLTKHCSIVVAKKEREMSEADHVGSGDKRWSLQGMTALVTGGTKGIG